MGICQSKFSDDSVYKLKDLNIDNLLEELDEIKKRKNDKDKKDLNSEGEGKPINVDDLIMNDEEIRKLMRE